jgi:putative Ca2+/H+ antiporter (TMEM165/GDT1 family)
MGIYLVIHYIFTELDMLYEIRTYTFKPLRGADWLALYQSEGLSLQQEFLGELIGFFTTEIGDISQIVHIWSNAATAWPPTVAGRTSAAR